MNMQKTNLRPGYSARFQSLRYLNTAGLCVEFYFWMDFLTTKSQPTVNLIVISEELDEQIIYSTIGQVLPGWNKVYKELPDGIFQIVIEGRRSLDGSSWSGISLDDISILPCTEFGQLTTTMSIVHPQMCLHFDDN